MKGSVIAAVILLSIIVFCVTASAYVSRFCDDLIATADICSEHAEKNDSEGVNDIIGKLTEKLNSNMHILEIFVDHRDLDAVENILAKLETAAKLNAYETIISECATLSRQLENLSTSDTLTVWNVF